MKLGDYVKEALERTYLHTKIKNWNGEHPFVVKYIIVEDGGVDPQWQITLSSELHKQMTDESLAWHKANNPLGGFHPPRELTDRWVQGFRESYSMTLCGDNIPEIVIEEEGAAEEISLDDCDQCGEAAWDGYICHACGMKQI